jgi:ankyrin repeat protein
MNAKHYAGNTKNVYFLIIRISEKNLQHTRNIDTRMSTSHIDALAAANFSTTPSTIPEMWRVASTGNVDEVRQLLLNGTDMNEEVSLFCHANTIPKLVDTSTAIQIAVRMRHDQVVQVFLQHGADVNCVNSFGESLLHIAVSAGSEVCVLVLINFKANVTVTDNEGITPLILATMNENHAVVEILELEESKRDKCAAFAMGHHKRLGTTSLIARLDPEVLRTVLEQV